MATEVEIGTIADIKQGRYLPPSAMASSPSKLNSIPVWGANGVIGFTNSHSYETPVALVTCRGNGCGIIQWTRDAAYISNNAMAIIPRASEPFDRRYLYYSLLRENFFDVTTGSAQPQITMSHLSKKLVYWNEISAERKAIAYILDGFDSKIELNRQMNEALEAMAQALFKSWFVDFDPVRAKSEGSSRLSRHISNLFPDSFEDSEIGEIPKGWSIMGLDDVADFLNGLALQKYPTKDEQFLPVIKIAQLRSGITKGADRASTDIPTAYVIGDGDILFSWSGSLECVLWAGGPGALNQHLFKVTSEKYPRWLCYLGVRHHLDEFRNIAAGKATTMGHIQRHHLSEAKLALPEPDLLHRMNTFFEPLIETIWHRNVQSRTLAAIRNSLLPKLISGELRLKNAPQKSGFAV